MYNLKTSQRVLYGETYLVISLEGRSLIPYQEDMLYENRLPGYLGLFTKYENEALVLYNITNCISLSNFIGYRGLTRIQYLMVVDSVVDAMILRDQYFLSENSLLIHQDYIYIKDNSDIALVYLPAEVDIDSKQALREFISWLTARLDINEPGASEASIPLQLMINNPSFNIMVLKETITQILSSDPYETAQLPRRQPRAPRISIPTDASNAPPVNKAAVKRKAQNKPSISVKKHENLFGIGRRKKKSDVEPDKKEAKAPKKRPARDGYADKNGYANKNVYANKNLYANKNQPAPGAPSAGYYSGGQIMVYLLFMPRTPYEQIIQVDKSPFTIGRGENSNYQINDIGISRVHAQIVVEGNMAYLIDSGSKFGTYINDIRLTPDVAAELRDDDRVMFSGLEFTVKILPVDYAIPR